ncbi:MAG: DUF59 domain-containing protein [Armatimonadetes bacterium]|nr:DUF59 domain-containing protein [Armatimonadota bacterium]
METNGPATLDTESLESRVTEMLHTVYDPEIPVNIYELGLIYGVTVEPTGKVEIRMTLTSPACPAAQYIPVEIEGKINAIAGVTETKVDVVWDPPWNPSRMSEAAKLSLGMF